MTEEPTSGPSNSSTRDIHGDYYPKETPDTVYDYLTQIEHEQVYRQILGNLPSAELKSLRILLETFEKFGRQAAENPGRFIEGNLLLGAPEREYRPTGDELVLSDVGTRIKSIVNSVPANKLKKYLKGINATLSKIEYNSFTFTHVDVMGSGRFFYVSEIRKERILFE